MCLCPGYLETAPSLSCCSLFFGTYPAVTCPPREGGVRKSYRKAGVCSGFLPSDKAQMVPTGKGTVPTVMAFLIIMVQGNLKVLPDHVSQLLLHRQKKPEQSEMCHHMTQLPPSLKQVSDAQESPLFPLPHGISETKALGDLPILLHWMA